MKEGELCLKNNNMKTVSHESITKCLIILYQQGSKIIHTPDQDKTDFRKCLEIVADQVKNEKVCVFDFCHLY